ncbi:MAG: hypothetical protein ACRDQA_10560 [Nocardioidaceae bacterium]
MWHPGTVVALLGAGDVVRRGRDAPRQQTKEHPVAWTWRIEKSDGSAAEHGLDVPEFSAQGDAETWLGEVWRDLAEAGAEQATLLDDQRVVYGPMSLLPE